MTDAEEAFILVNAPLEITKSWLIVNAPPFFFFKAKNITVQTDVIIMMC